MKSYFFTITMLLSFCSYSQNITKLTEEEGKEIEKKEHLEAKVNRKVIFGVSLGYLTVFDEIYEARISPINNKIIIDKLTRQAYLLSTGVAIPFGNMGKLGGAYYRKLDEKGKPYGNLYYVPSGLHFVASVNLVMFNSAATGSIYNNRLDGGLGVGYRASEDFLLSLTYEMISYRQPREFILKDYKEKAIEIDGKVLTALAEDNNDYFRNRYMPAISFKFVYLFGGDKIRQ